MDKDTLKSTLLQTIGGEIDQLADILAGEFEDLLENGGPKGFEEKFATAIKAFGVKQKCREFS